jgi:hypothetical protein
VICHRPVDRFEEGIFLTPPPDPIAKTEATEEEADDGSDETSEEGDDGAECDACEPPVAEFEYEARAHDEGRAW